MAKIEIGQYCGIVRRESFPIEYIFHHMVPQISLVCTGRLYPHPGISWLLVCDECKSISMRPAY